MAYYPDQQAVAYGPEPSGSDARDIDASTAALNKINLQTQAIHEQINMLRNERDDLRARCAALSEQLDAVHKHIAEARQS